MTIKSNPVLVDVYRNSVVESCHRGSVIAVNHNGETIFSMGDVERHIYPRSALKMFQAIPLVESGAADRFRLSESEIALACASHNAEAGHVDAVESWLDRLGLDTDALENGPDWPLSRKAKFDLLRGGGKPTRVHHNCSGKHAGMLTLARHLNMDTKGYSRYDHGAQQAWMQTLSELVGLDVNRLEWEKDGCGMPAICMPMNRLAYGCALFANPENISGPRKEAMKKILFSITRHPFMLAGTDRCCTDVIKTTGGKVIVKMGAEAVYAGIIAKQGIGIVLKIDDGAGRGSEVALGAALDRLGVITAAEKQALERHFSPVIYNSRKKKTGRIVASKSWNEIAAG